MNHIPTLETVRLRLRPFELADALTVQRLAGDRAIADTTLSIPHPYLDGMAEAWISTHADNFASSRSLTLAITLKTDSSVVGAIGFTNIVPGHKAELGYWIGKPFWNQGLCTEAAQAILDYAFRDLLLVRVFAHHLTRNPPSGRVMQKLGMHHEGSLRRHARKWDIFEDIELYGLLKEEWKLGEPGATGNASIMSAKNTKPATRRA